MNPRVVFMGGTRRGLAVLEMLIAEKVNVVYAVIMPEDNHEPYQIIEELRSCVTRNNISFSEGKRMNDQWVVDILAKSPDVTICCSWRTIIPKHFYEAMPMGCLVAHDSLLPKYRCFAPTAWAMINGEKETGVSVFKIGEGPADSGDMFKQKVIPISSQDNATTVYERLIPATVELYRDFIYKCRTGSVSFEPQDESLATYTCKRTPEDGRINWNQPTQKVFDFIRALNPPYPYAWTNYKNERIRIAKASLLEGPKKYSGIIPGRVVEVNDKGVEVLCSDGPICIHDILNASGECIPAETKIQSITQSLS